MGAYINLRAVDGFTSKAYTATPAGEPRGGVVVIQEIFGVNSHIREVVDGYAAAGYYAIAPQIFDRVERDVELGYEDDDMQQGIKLAFQDSDRDLIMLDLQSAVENASRFGKVGVVGYCFGGLLTWLSAANLDGVACASGYYGGGIAGELAQQPRCPTMLHFGEKDAMIPMTDVDQVRAAHPDVAVHVYDADHGFNCNHRASFDQSASDQARERTLAFFAEHVG